MHGVAARKSRHRAAKSSGRIVSGLRKRIYFPEACFKRLVIGPGKSLVLGIGQESHPRKTWLKIRQAIISGMIINDNDLGLQAADRLLHGVQTKLQKVLHLVIDDDDGQVHVCELRVFYQYIQKN